MFADATLSRRQLVLTAGGVAVAGALATHQITQSAALQDAAKPQRGGELTILWSSDFVSMDPIHSNGTTRAAVYDWLLSWRADDQGAFSVQPMLATEWETSDTAITFKIREGVTFHDGSELNAEVVAWNLKRMVQDPQSFAKPYFSAVNADNPAEVVDSMTVRLNLTRPSASILPSLSDATLETAIVSKKAFDDNDAEWLNSHPVGTGPFTFESWTTGDSLKVVKNPNYWQMGVDGQPLPYVDRVNYRVIISIATEFAEMRAGTADFMRNVPGRDVPTAKQATGTSYLDAPLFGLRRQYFFNALKLPFQDNLKLRQAIQHSIDRDAIAKALGGELGQPLPYEFVPGTIGYDDTLPYYEFDLDKAKALIAESGAATPVKSRLTVHSRDLDQQQAQIIQAMVAKIGVEITLDVVEDVAWGEQVRINNDFEMATRQTGTQVDPTNSLLNVWAVEGNSGYSRATVPNLLETIRAADSTYDRAERQRLFGEAQKLMYESAWMGYMWFEVGNVLINNRVNNFPIVKGSPAVWGSLRESEWWLEG